MEIRVNNTQPFPFTAEWYAERDHAPHLEQEPHQGRLSVAADMAYRLASGTSVVDIGAGDGGLLSLLRQKAFVGSAWGYDLMPANVEYARETRGVDVRLADAFTDDIEWGEVAVITECLEHLDDPHAVVEWIALNATGVVASSPANETLTNHDAVHVWIWDMEGYQNMFADAGWTIMEHVQVDGFQVLKAFHL